MKVYWCPDCKKTREYEEGLVSKTCSCCMVEMEIVEVMENAKTN